MSHSPIDSLIGSKPLIIFHWDVDGIASAALLKKYLDLNNPILYTPLIGFYKIDFEEILSHSGFDSIFIVDFGVGTSEIERLRDMTDTDVYVFDHHVRSASDRIVIFTYLDKDNEVYPSTTLLVTELLGINPNFLTVLGLVGDLFGKVLESKYSKILYHDWNVYGFGYRDIKLFVDLIQSNYVYMDRDEIIHSVDKLIMALDDPYLILDEKKWRERYRGMYRVINSVLKSELSLVDNIRFLELDEKLYITSYVGRYLAEKYRGDYILIGVPELLAGYSQVYLRISGGSIPRYRELIDKLNTMGAYAGGKDNVVGVFMDRNLYSDVLELVLNWVKM